MDNVLIAVVAFAVGFLAFGYGAVQDYHMIKRETWECSQQDYDKSVMPYEYRCIKYTRTKEKE